jgi:hypothetical protein
MLLLHAPAGANCNYISIIINNNNKKEIIKNLVYHKLGTHNSIIRVIKPSENLEEIKKYLTDKKYIACFVHFWREEFNEFHKEKNILSFQIFIDDYKEIVIINWFEKFIFNYTTDQDKLAGQQWLKNQDNVWKNYTSFTTERAVVHWLYNIDTKPGFKKECSFKKIFNFSSMYNSFELTKNEFLKFNINYSKEMYNTWKDSQKIIFDSWNLIKNNVNTPENLEHFYQRGIAIALNGLKNNLKEQECWDQLSKKLQ